jgi:hypothetical protein
MFKLAGSGAAYSNLIVDGGALEPLLQLVAEHVVVESGDIFLQFFFCFGKLFSWFCFISSMANGQWSYFC